MHRITMHMITTINYIILYFEAASLFTTVAIYGSSFYIQQHYY